jgi:hypothetical protein
LYQNAQFRDTHSPTQNIHINLLTPTSFLTYTRTVTKFAWPKLFLRTWMFLLFIYFSCLWRKKECKGRKMTIPYMFCRSFCTKLHSLDSGRCRHTLLNCMKRQSCVTCCCAKKFVFIPLIFCGLKFNCLSVIFCFKILRTFL